MASDRDGHTINAGPVTVGIDTDAFMSTHDRCNETMDRLKTERDHARSFVPAMLARAEKAEAEVDRLRAENVEKDATINELAVLFEDHTGAPPHISTGVVEPKRA